MDKLIRFKDIVSVGLSDILATAIGGFFWFYLASILVPEQYGQLSYYLGIVGIFLSLTLVGTPHVITVYSAKKIELHSTLYLISILAGFGSFIIIMFFLSRLDVGFLIIGTIIGALSMAELLGKKLYLEYLKYNLFQKSLVIILGLGFYYIFGFNGIIFGLALSYIPFSHIIYKRFRNSKINFQLLKSRKKFVLHNYGLRLTDGFRDNIDKLIIVPIMGFSVLGNYSLSLQFIAVLMTFSSVVFKYILPRESSGLYNIKLKKMTVLIAIGISIFGVVALPLIFPLVFPTYSDAVEAVQIISLSVVPMTISLLLWSKFLSIEKSSFMIISRIIMIVTIVTGIAFLGPVYGIKGIAISYVASSTLEAVFLSIVNKRLK